MTKEIVRIDRFTVPVEAHQELLEKVQEIHSKLRTLPGFLRDRILEGEGKDGQRQLITIVEWDDQQSIGNARDTMQQYHAERGFNPARFCEERGISMEFGAYRPLVQEPVA
jgi:heme-degrading monooxygenase HmoA